MNGGKLILISSEVWAALDTILGAYILLRMPRAVRALRLLTDRYRLQMSGGYLTAGIYLTSVASASQVLLNFGYLYYVWAGGEQQLPFQFPDVAEYWAAAFATGLRTMAGGLSRLFFVIAATIVCEWLIAHPNLADFLFAKKQTAAEAEILADLIGGQDDESQREKQR